MKTNFRSFETDRLIIRPTSIIDSDFILELFNSPKWIENIGDRNIGSGEEAKKYIEKNMLPQLKRLGYSNYTVIRKLDNAKIGSCGLYDREGLDGIDIGFAFLPQYEKKGYAYESVSMLKEIAVKEFNFPQILGITSRENTDSQKLLQKIGLEFEKMIKLPNSATELLLYKLNERNGAKR